jgi:hypothetical protein
MDWRMKTGPYKYMASSSALAQGWRHGEFESGDDASSSSSDVRDAAQQLRVERAKMARMIAAIAEFVDANAPNCVGLGRLLETICRRT